MFKRNARLFFCAITVACGFSIGRIEALIGKTTAQTDSWRVLIKISVDSGPERFFSNLDQYYAKLSNKHSVHFLASCAADDIAMKSDSVKSCLAKYQNLNCSFDKTELLGDNFDLLIIADGDVIPQVSGYDDIVVQKMKKAFPDGDGVLCICDESANDLLCRYPVMGRKYYQRFGYVYHPHYTSSFGKNELFEVARKLGKYNDKFLMLFKKNDTKNYDNGAVEKLVASDRETFRYRRAAEFNLHPITKQVIKLSLLIPTLVEREKTFTQLCAVLEGQIL
jgi:hypothetical protein